MGSGSRERPLDLGYDIDNWPWSENISSEDFDAISLLHFNYVRVGEQIDEQATSKELRTNTSTYYIRELMKILPIMWSPIDCMG